MFGFDVPSQNQHLHPPSFPLPPIASLSTRTNNIQDQQMKPILILVHCIQSLPPPTNGGTMINAASAGATAANQLNQPAVAAIPNEIYLFAAIPNEIYLNSDYHEENNNPVASRDYRFVNLDLTLGI